MCSGVGASSFKEEEILVLSYLAAFPSAPSRSIHSALQGESREREREEREERERREREGPFFIYRQEGKQQTTSDQTCQ